jgi:hypothetical protein
MKGSPGQQWGGGEGGVEGGWKRAAGGARLPLVHPCQHAKWDRERQGRNGEGGRRKEEGGRRKNGYKETTHTKFKSLTSSSSSASPFSYSLANSRRRDIREMDTKGTEGKGREDKGGTEGRGKEGGGGRRKKGHKETTYTKFKSPIPSSSSAPPFSYSLANSNMASASPWSEASVRYFTAFARSLSTPLA